MDAVDKKILSSLASDSKLSYSQIGEKVNLSAPAVHARVKKMEEAGVIQNYSIRVNPLKVAKGLCAFISVGIGPVTCLSIAEKLKVFPEVEECHSIAGEDCLLIKVRTETTPELDEVIFRIRKVPGVTRTLTTIVLSSLFERPFV